MADTDVLAAVAPPTAVMSSISSFSTSSSPSSSLNSDATMTSDSACDVAMVVVALPFCFCLGCGEREEREERDEAGFETGEDEPATGESRGGTMPENLIEWRR